MTDKQVLAAVLLIGDELLSGRTRDINLSEIAKFLSPLGVSVAECRVVRDEQDEIVAAVNHLRGRYDYVFTTGGIGPTHDDITADAIAAAFNLHIDVRADALAIIEDWYAKSKTPLTESRKRMARVPEGASLIANPVTGAPGFQTGNVFTLAGVPKIARGMLEDVAHRIEGGSVTYSRTVATSGLREGDLADGLGDLAKAYPEVSIGSYPYFFEGPDGEIVRGTNLVARSTDEVLLNDVTGKLADLSRSVGGKPVIDPPDAK
ncbi:competence/damage-inducible protein A [Hyphobacterium indicum]|uniref:competence/damage-inducible protein A n=1 Tax=Hyphobacterium indicum TaxID=2162714 RepID=UPI000D6487A5|nr:molybdopterin-binding protein [Hyphobacterium indicum]